MTGDLTHNPEKVHSEPISETVAWIESVLADRRVRESASDKKSKEIE